MESIRKFQVTLEFNSPCLYISNKEENMMKDLNTMYKNKCYGGYYIININSILNSSYARTINTNPTCICIVNVCFEADILQYSIGGIIAKTQICIAEGQTCGVTDTTIIAFSKSATTQILSEGQIIPIRIGNKIDYKTNTDKVGILGSILLPQATATIYKLTGVLDLTNKNIFNSYLETIGKQEKRIKKESEKFIKLLNSYKNTKNDGINIINIINDTKINPIDVTGYWSKNLKTNCHLCLYNKVSNINTQEYVETTLIDAFLSMIKECVNIRQGIIDLTNTYHNEKMYKQCENVWQLINRNKLS